MPSKLIQYDEKKCAMLLANYIYIYYNIYISMYICGLVGLHGVPTLVGLLNAKSFLYIFIIYIYD